MKLQNSSVSAQNEIFLTLTKKFRNSKLQHEVFIYFLFIYFNEGGGVLILNTKIEGLFLIYFSLIRDFTKIDVC